MFDAISILTVTGAILASIWLSLRIARLLLSAILLSMHHAAHRGAIAPAAPSSPNPILKPTLSILKSEEDLHRR